MTDRPVLVVGAQRSGTTLVRLLLDAHPAIAIGPETLFLVHVRDGAKAVVGTGPRKRDDDYDLDVHATEALLSEGWTSVFRAHARSRGAARWGEKSPVHRYHGERINRLYPDSQVVCVVRHPAAVARSRGQWGYEGEQTVQDWAASVRWHVEDARRFGPRRFHLLRYEDLLADPRAVLAELLAFLREPWDDAVLDHTAGVEAGTTTDGGTVASDPLDPSRALAWTEDVDPADLGLLEQFAADELALLGYAADLTTPVLPLPHNELTARPPAPDTRAAMLRALRERGPGELVGRVAREVRERGVGEALRRWRGL